MAKPITLQSAEHVEARFPGMTAVAGPYGVNFIDKDLRKHERALCVRSFRDQQKVCPKSKVVMHGPKAWIIRKKPLITEAADKMKTFHSGSYGIKAGKGGAQG